MRHAPASEPAFCPAPVGIPLVLAGGWAERAADRWLAVDVW